MALGEKHALGTSVGAEIVEPPSGPYADRVEALATVNSNAESPFRPDRGIHEVKRRDFLDPAVPRADHADAVLRMVLVLSIIRIRLNINPQVFHTRQYDRGPDCLGYI